MSSLSITKQIHFTKGHRSRKVLREGTRKVIPSGRIPRISRLMALAIHMQELLDKGVVSTYSQLAELGHVSRARVSQIMKLNLLAPDIQEKLLFLPPVESGRDPVSEHSLRSLLATPGWRGRGGCSLPLVQRCK